MTDSRGPGTSRRFAIGGSRLAAWIVVASLGPVLPPSAGRGQDPSAGTTRTAPPATTGTAVSPPAAVTPGAVAVPPGTTAPAGTEVVPPGTAAAAAAPAVPTPNPAAEAGPPSAAEGSSPSNDPSAPKTSAPAAPPGPPGTTAAGEAAAGPATGGPPVRTNVFRAARDSIFGRTDYATWHPLPLKTLFSEGWDEAWIGPPNGSRGGPRQGWIDAADGNFYRLGFFAYTFTNSLAQGGNGHVGSFTLYTPLSRRLSLITQNPFIDSNQPTFSVGKQGLPNPSTAPGRSRNRTPTGFGDLAITPRVMLRETENLSLVAELTVQIPTGYRGTGAGQAILTPGVQFWSNFAPKWIARGGFNVGVGTNPQAGGTTLLSQLAVGRVFTPHDTPLFGDFTVYLSANVFDNVSTGRNTTTLTPGFRTHLGKSFYFLGGLNVPVTGPRPYEESATFWIMKVF